MDSSRQNVRGSGETVHSPGRRPGALARFLRRAAFQTLLVIAVLLPVIGILVVIGLDRQGVYGEETAEARSFLTLSHRNAERLITNMAGTLEILEDRLARNPPISDNTFQEVVDRWRGAVGTHLKSIGQLSPEGSTVVFSGPTPPPVSPVRLREARASGGTMVFAIPDPLPGQPSQILALRWLKSSPGNRSGFLAATLDSRLLEEFFDTLELGPRGGVFLLTPTGRIASGTTRRLEDAGAPDVWASEAVSSATTGGVVLPPADARDTRIAMAEPVQNTPFTLLLIRDSEDAFRAWRNRALALGVLAGAPLMVACGLAAAALQKSRALKHQSRVFASQASTLTTTLESVDDAIVTFDAAGRITVANRAALQLLSASDAPTTGARPSPPPAGRRLSEFGLRWRTSGDASSPDPRADRAGADLIDALVRRACAGERIGPVELAAFSARALEPLRLSAILRPIPSSEDGPAGAVLVLHDRTGERAIEEKLRHSEKMQAIGQLTGGVAHDFNNLLLVILGGAEELGDRIGADPALRRTTALIIQAAERGAALTRRLLAFARRQTLAPQDVDVPTLLRDSLPLLTRTAGASVSVVIGTAPEIWRVRIDPEQLVIGLVNLVANARDAMPGGGRVTIRVANEPASPRERSDGCPGDHVSIRVSDTGSGMTPEVRTRAIDPFFSTKGPGAGTGLGLSMVYGFVRQSGGRLRIESQPGAGARITLLLPRAEEALNRAGFAGG